MTHPPTTTPVCHDHAATLEIKGFSGHFRFLSNFYESPVCLDGVIYPTVEHAYQAAKTLDMEARKNIEQEPSPGKVKRLGKKVTIREDWEEVKVSIMTNLVVQKFQHDELKQQLLDTKDLYIEETNHWGLQQSMISCTIVSHPYQL